MTQKESKQDHPAVSQGRKRLKMLLGGLCAILACVAVRYYWGSEPANAAAPNKPATKTSSNKTEKSESSSAQAKKPEDTELNVPNEVARVNTKRITRDDLAGECLRQHGKDVLEIMVNNLLIVQECKRKNITVTSKEIDEEVSRLAQRFNIPVDRWLTMLKQERNITPKQYANDIIWPTLALRKLAGVQLQVSNEEKIKEYETNYGESVRARLIAVNDLQSAKDIRAQAMENPDEFGNLAKEKSVDAPSASAKGLIQPIRKHGSYKEIEDAVFNMADGEISPVIQAGSQYVILKREELIPAKQVKYEEVAPQLEEVVRNRKMRVVAEDLYKKMQDAAKIENIWNDPQKHAQMPDTAAIINGSPISIRDLKQECIDRHGLEVLEGMINRMILEDACMKHNISVTEDDVQKELEHEAMLNVKPNPDGSPDIESWLEIVVKRGVSKDIYRSHVLWATAAMKKLVRDQVDITDEDLKKAYEANFGPRVQCLAIVFDNERRASQVFEMARKNNSAEYFGQLASQYSIEPGSQSLRGEVPSIRMNGGQPILEKEAFALKPGELSGIIPIDDKFVLLRCQSIKEAVNVDFAKVRDDLYDDILEKKLHIAMQSSFEKLQDMATVDNYLAGTSHSPSPSANEKGNGAAVGAANGQIPANVPEFRQTPGN